ncbi:MAG: flagellin [bacterium]|nr:flagellin [bacterium]
MRIMHNISSLIARRNLENSNHLLLKNLEKLSSGYRINRASDDAAGLAISEKFRTQVAGLEQAIKNTRDGISLIQTAEGALTEIQMMVQRMRVLAVQCANETYTSTDRSQAQVEVKQLIEEIDRMASAVQFNTKQLFKGHFDPDTKIDGKDGEPLRLHIGANKDEILRITIKRFTASGLNILNQSISTMMKAESAITRFQSAINLISIQRANFGAYENRLDHIINGLGIAYENMSASESRIKDLDMAMEMSDFTKNQILAQAGTAMLAQSNSQPQMVLQLLGG